MLFFILKGGYHEENKNSWENEIEELYLLDLRDLIRVDVKKTFSVHNNCF